MATTPYKIFQKLYQAYGKQHWWPAESAFEVMVGAILTQNTSWTNVETALAILKQKNLLDSEKIAGLSHQRLAHYLKSVGYFNVKASRLQSFCRWYNENGQLIQLLKLNTKTLRHELLSVHGIGPETADDILLYAFEREVFVIDAYTKRLFTRLGLLTGNEGYEALRLWFERKLSRHAGKVKLFNEYHALIVHHAKYVCQARRPRCTECCLCNSCDYDG